MPKIVGSKVYAHRSCPQDACDGVSRLEFNLAKTRLPDGFPWSYVAWNKKTKSFSFMFCPGWDTEPEPRIAFGIKVQMLKENLWDHFVGPCGAKWLPQNRENPQIIHGKHLFVRPTYRGFDVELARKRWDRYQAWPWLDKRRMGRWQWWRTHAIEKLMLMER